MHVCMPWFISDWTATGLCVCLSDRLSVDDLAAVQRKIFAVRTEWYNLGLELGQQVSTLDSIEDKYRGDPSKCFRHVLKEWLKGVDPPPTWQGMVNALKSPTVTQHQVAERIETELSPQPPSASAQPHPKLPGLCDYFNFTWSELEQHTEFLTIGFPKLNYVYTVQLHVCIQSAANTSKTHWNVWICWYPSRWIEVIVYIHCNSWAISMCLT